MPTIYGTSASETLRGTEQDDIIYGRAGNDVIYGYGGNDRLDGGAGADVMRGGSGNDVYYVDNSSDQVLELARQGLDTVRTNLSFYQLPNDTSIERLVASDPLGTGPVDLFGNRYANSITGNAGPNVLNGQGGHDTLSGLAGNDFLTGGTGRDRLTGGPGEDVFSFVDGSWDRIFDFESGVDTIELGALISGTQFDFIGASPFSGTAGEGRFSDNLFELDLNGDAIADLRITITAQVVETDFTFTPPSDPWGY